MLASLIQTTTTTTETGSAAGAIIFLVIGLGFLVLFLAGYWKLFVKLGLPGWMGIVPFVNVYMIFKARGTHEPVLWTILSIIPCVSIVAAWFLANDTAEMFKKEIGWKIFLFLIPGLSHLILGFGSAEADRTQIAPGVGLNAAA